MKGGDGFQDQFHVLRDYYLSKLDFLEWYRYYFAVREVLDRKPRRILEVGSGNEVVRNCLRPLVENYVTMDINSGLFPDVTRDLRDFQPALKNEFDCVIVLDVLEHMPFSDLRGSLANIHSYLKEAGAALITIPHRRSHFLYMTPLRYEPTVITIPTGLLSPRAFYRRFIQRKIWIDPFHCWEIGDGKVRQVDIDCAIKEAGFGVEKFKKLLYVDFWVCKRESAKATELDESDSSFERG